MGKKNLDKLYQEKLKDFSDLPDEKVWQSIEASLDEKRNSRKVIPIWWKLGSVAALLLLGFFLINPFENDSSDPAVTNVNTPSEKTSNENNEKQSSEQLNVNSTREDASIVNSEQEDEKVNKNLLKVSDEQIVTSSNTSESTSKSSKNVVTSNIVQKNTNISVDQVVVTNKQDTQTTNRTPNKSILETTLSAQNENATAISSVKKNGNQLPLTKVDNLAITEDNTSQANSVARLNQEDTEKELENSKKKSIFDEIAAQKEEETIVENTGSKWSAGPSLAPVYFDAIGEGSPVHSIFVPNSKSGEVTLSYGISVAYEVSKKLSIRSGLHKVDYGYNTNDVEFSSSIETSASAKISNVDYVPTSKNLIVSSNANPTFEAFSQNPLVNAAEISDLNPTHEGVMEQQFGYIEVPLELNYALIDKRFGINLIGGVSSLFLVDNSISLTTGQLTTEVGKANNINTVNFSTNFGFGVNYKFTPKMKFSIEPLFKYQLNTFSQTEGNFQPFSIGVYSGLSFKF